MFKDLVKTLSVKKLVYKIDGCVAVALEKLRSVKGINKGCGPMYASGLEEMIKKYRFFQSDVAHSGLMRTAD